MDIEVAEIKAGDSLKTRSSKRRAQRAKKKRMEKNEAKIAEQMCGNLDVPEKIGDCKIVTDTLEKSIPVIDSPMQPAVEDPVSAPIDSIPGVNTNAKQRKKRKRVKKVKSKDELVGVDQSLMDIESTVNPAEGGVSGKRKRRKRKKVAKVKDAIQSTNPTNEKLNLQLSDRQEIKGIHIENELKAAESEFSTSKETSLSDIVLDKDKLLSSGKDSEPVDVSKGVEVPSNVNSSVLAEVVTEPSMEPMEEKLLSLETIEHRPSQTRMGDEDETSNGGINVVNIECAAQESEFSSRKESSLSDLGPSTANLLDSCKDRETVDLSDVVADSSNRILSELGEGPGPRLKPMEVEQKLVPLEIQNKINPDPVDEKNETCKSGMNGVNYEGRNTFSSHDIGVAEHIASPDVKEAECVSTDLHPGIVPRSVRIKKKLIVLDVNGLLAHIVMPPPLDCTADAYILGRAIFKRPFCDDFLKFCFQHFDVGIWSSRSKRIIDRVVTYLLGGLRNKLKFCWDMYHSTQTGYNTLENRHKPLVCKELSKIWENEDPTLPWKKGDYNESNTLLLDDSPYKALLNPLHTAIFPHSYQYQNKNDNSLGPGGDLRVYLQGLLTSENVQKYVEQHPLGQGAINESNLSWGFYSGVLQTLSNQTENNPMPYLV
ncbi:uncharacterized protein LOC127258545 [Andrographis paniculata]|uniref:uncharacterized protein LOC127258545 n=1 Tax=Andrographis paniculata TaxID=175694 RepID=UPI0021E95525|nr:uncharacterized protein LOC127258545 [Andrographis paniculata]